MTAVAVDPKKLVITTPGRQYNTPDADSTVVFLPADNFLDNSVDQVGAYVQQFGTLKTLTIVGHGAKLRIASMEDVGEHDTTVMGIHEFLAKLLYMQVHTGIKIADRIVFDACATMTNLKPDDVQDLRDTAKLLGSEIVGATTITTGRVSRDGKTPIIDKGELGLFAAFEPDGNVRRDRLSTTIYDRIASKNKRFDQAVTGGDPVQTLLIAPVVKVVASAYTLLNGDKELTDLRGEETTDSKWFDCYAGKTPQDGAACLARENFVPKARADSRDTSTLKAKIGDDGAAAKKAEKPVGLGAVQGAPSP